MADDFLSDLHKDAEGRLPEDVAGGNGRMPPPHAAGAPPPDAAPPDEKEKAALGWDPPVGRFPECVWRGVFALYCRAMEKSSAASDVAHFVTFWAAVAAALGRLLYMHQGRRLYPNVYLCYYGPTNDSKTTAESNLLDGNLLAARDDVPILMVTGSAEGLADAVAIATKSGVFIFYWEEFVEALTQMGRTGSMLMGLLIRCFDCPGVYSFAYRKNPVRIDNPTPSILTATTPEWFWEVMTAAHFRSGFGNRFLYFTGKRKPPMPMTEDPDREAIVEIRRHLGRLKNVPPGEVLFSDAARRLWIDFYTQWEDRDLPSLALAATQRVRIYVLKLGMAYAALEGSLPYLEEDQLASAIAMGRYAGRCAEHLIDLQTAPSGVAGDLNDYLVQYIRTHDGLSYRELYHNTKRRVGDAKTLNDMVDHLCRAERIAVVYEETTSGKRKTKKVLYSP
jgi:hypothetical protein